MDSVRLKVSGMTCGHCRAAVEKALAGSPGVRNATVLLESGAAEVEFEEGAVAPEQLVEAVRGSGYEAEIVGTDPAGDR